MKDHCRILLAILMVCLFVSLDAGADKVVKVFILAGQSNMEGKGLATHLDTYKEDPLIKPWYGVVKDGDHAISEATDAPVLMIKVAWGGKSIFNPSVRRAIAFAEAMSKLHASQ